MNKIFVQLAPGPPEFRETLVQQIVLSRLPIAGILQGRLPRVKPGHRRACHPVAEELGVPALAAVPRLQDLQQPRRLLVAPLDIQAKEDLLEILFADPEKK
jgi:hypothetical protein